MFQLKHFSSNGAVKTILPAGKVKANSEVVFYIIDGWFGTILTNKAHRKGDCATYSGLLNIVNPSDSVLGKVLVFPAPSRCVYFEGIAWMGDGQREVIAGVSAKGSQRGSQLKNTADKDVFLRHTLADGEVKFESVANPGFYISADGTRAILGAPD